MMQRRLQLFILVLLLFPAATFAQKRKPSFPPALVVTAPIRMEKVSPTAPYSGTVHFKDISEGG